MNRQAIPRPQPRGRPLYAVLALAVIAAGLLWRSGLLPLPPFAFKYGGDALWALVVFYGCGFLLNRTSTPSVALMVFHPVHAIARFRANGPPPYQPWAPPKETHHTGQLRTESPAQKRLRTAKRSNQPGFQPSK